MPPARLDRAELSDILDQMDGLVPVSFPPGYRISNGMDILRSQQARDEAVAEQPRRRQRGGGLLHDIRASLPQNLIGRRNQNLNDSVAVRFLNRPRDPRRGVAHNVSVRGMDAVDGIDPSDDFESEPSGRGRAVRVLASNAAPEQRPEERVVMREGRRATIGNSLGSLFHSPPGHRQPEPGIFSRLARMTGIDSSRGQPSSPSQSILNRAQGSSQTGPQETQPPHHVTFRSLPPGPARDSPPRSRRPSPAPSASSLFGRLAQLIGNNNAIDQEHFPEASRQATESESEPLGNFDSDDGDDESEEEGDNDDDDDTNYWSEEDDGDDDDGDDQSRPNRFERQRLLARRLNRYRSASGSSHYASIFPHYPSRSPSPALIPYPHQYQLHSPGQNLHRAPFRTSILLDRYLLSDPENHPNGIVCIVYSERDRTAIGIEATHFGHWEYVHSERTGRGGLVEIRYPNINALEDWDEADADDYEIVDLRDMLNAELETFMPDYVAFANGEHEERYREEMGWRIDDIERLYDRYDFEPPVEELSFVDVLDFNIHNMGYGWEENNLRWEYPGANYHVNAILDSVDNAEGSNSHRNRNNNENPDPNDPNRETVRRRNNWGRELERRGQVAEDPRRQEEWNRLDRDELGEPLPLYEAKERNPPPEYVEVEEDGGPLCRMTGRRSTWPEGPEGR